MRATPLKSIEKSERNYKCKEKQEQCTCFWWELFFILEVAGIMGRREKTEVLSCLCISTYNLKYLHFHPFFKIAVKCAKQVKLWEVSKVWAVGEQEQINGHHHTQSYEPFHNAHFPKCMCINKFSESGNKKHSSWWWVNSAWYSRFHWNSLKESNILR